MIDAQYIESVKKGSTVIYGDRSYRVQDDGKGWLHIVVKKRKIGIDKILFFDYGSFQDYVFNGWFQEYENYEIFKSFASSEKKWLCA